MRSIPKLALMTVIVTMFLLPSISMATLADLQWRVQVGDSISYTYRGSYTSEVNVSGSIEEIRVILEEDIYFVVEDLTGIPLPGIGGISSTPYWSNGTPLDQEGQDEGWFAGNIDLIDPIAVKVGNWTLYTEPVLEYWESANTETTTFNASIAETAQIWNVSVSVYWPDDNLIGTLLFSYSKSTGLLDYSNDTRIAGGVPNSLALSRIISPPDYTNIVVIGGVATIAVAVIVIISVKRRQ